MLRSMSDSMKIASVTDKLDVDLLAILIMPFPTGCTTYAQGTQLKTDAGRNYPIERSGIDSLSLQNKQEMRHCIDVEKVELS